MYLVQANTLCQATGKMASAARERPDLLWLRPDAQIALECFPARSGTPDCFIGNGGRDNHILARTPINRRGHGMLSVELDGVKRAQHLSKFRPALIG